MRALMLCGAGASAALFAVPASAQETPAPAADSSTAPQDDQAATPDIVVTGTLLRTDGSFLRLWVEGFLLAAHIPALADLKRSYHVRFGELLERALLEAQASGALDPQLDVAAAAQAVMALADGLMLYTLVPGLGPAPEQVAAVLAGVSALLGRQGRS